STPSRSRAGPLDSAGSPATVDACRPSMIADRGLTPLKPTAQPASLARGRANGRHRRPSSRSATLPDGQMAARHDRPAAPDGGGQQQPAGEEPVAAGNAPPDPSVVLRMPGNQAADPLAGAGQPDRD